MILHEDPPATPGDGIEDLGQTSEQKLREMANKYFGCVKGINTSGMGISLKSMRAEFSKVCPVDHIR